MTVRATKKPRILAFADVRGSLVAACRVYAPLAALRKAGLIDDYVVTDATLRGAPRGGGFDVVWLQRGADSALARLVATRLAGRFLLDIDDHLLCRPTYLSAEEMPDADALVRALQASRVVTVHSTRLAALLQRRAGLDLGDKTRVCANALAFDDHSLRDPRPPVALLLTQGHRLALTGSAEDVLTAVTEFSARRRLPLWCLGSPPPFLLSDASPAGSRVAVLAPRSFERYHLDLAGGPVLLGIAPLETRGDADTNEFVSGKSDIKMVEFGGYGHPAVFSRAAPYVDTDISCGRLANNDHASWTAALEDVYETGSRALAAEQATIRSRRGMDDAARDAWWPAVEAARLDEPVDAAMLLREADRLLAKARDRVARARWRLRHR